MSKGAKTETIIQGDVCLRIMKFEKAEDYVPGHAHDFAHALIICRGKVRLRYRRPMQEVHDEKVMEAVSYINLDAGVEHDLIALSNNTVAICVHPDRPGKTWLEIIA